MFTATHFLLRTKLFAFALAFAASPKCGMLCFHFRLSQNILLLPFCLCPLVTFPVWCHYLLLPFPLSRLSDHPLWAGRSGCWFLSLQPEGREAFIPFVRGDVFLCSHWTPAWIQKFWISAFLAGAQIQVVVSSIDCFRKPSPKWAAILVSSMLSQTQADLTSSSAL